jgi:two-component system, chemotaxis family, response regulator Rcp1
MNRTPATSKTVDILLVEDNPADVRLTELAFEEGRVTNHLYVAEDGVEAMAFLRRGPGHENAPRPDLILLDLNLPRKDGREVLAEIKADEELKRIPVVVLTTSEDEKDILKSYNLHANCYIHKPVDFKQFMHIVQSLEGFWLTVVRLPPK